MKKIQKRLLLLIIITGAFLPLIQVRAGFLPVAEELDLTVDGSINPVFLNQTAGKFSFIMRIIFILHWENNAIDLDDFANIDNGLANGTLILYENEQFDKALLNHHDFAHISYDMEIQSDDKNPKDNHLASRLSFWKFVPGGLDVQNGQVLTFAVRDDLTAVDAFAVFIEGYFIPDSAIGSKAPFVFDPVDIVNFWITNVIPVAAIGIMVLVAGIAVWKVATAWR